MFPVSLSFVTYNLWGTKRWPQRKPALRQFIELFKPNVSCVQQLSEQTRTCLDAAMPQYARVHDDFPGWYFERHRMIGPCRPCMN